MKKIHTFKLKVYYEDTDSGGVVYYANYLRFLERARTEFITKEGFTNRKLKNENNILLVVKSCNIEFIKPSFLEDELIIQTSIEKLSKIQIFLHQKIFRNEEIIISADVRIVSINSKGKVSKLPDKFYKNLKN